MLNGILGELCHQVSVGSSRKRDKIIYVGLADHDSRRVSGCVSGQAFKLSCHIDQRLDLRIRVIHFLQILTDLERHVDRHLLR